MNSAPVILQLTPLVSDSVGPVCVTTLEHHGLGVTLCATLAELTRQVLEMHVKPDTRVVTIVDGRERGDIPVVLSLRASRPSLGIVALVNTDDETSIIQLLHMGIDAHCSVDASPDLLVAIVLRLLCRLGAGQNSTPAPAVGSSLSQQSASWQLVDQGWALCSPEEVRVTLTTGERAFLSMLLNAPSMQATHAELIDAVNASYNHADGYTHQSRLGVMVSRMRRKFQQAGAPLPLKSVHNWGYMFVVDS